MVILKLDQTWDTLQVIFVQQREAHIWEARRWIEP